MPRDSGQDRPRRTDGPAQDRPRRDEGFRGRPGGDTRGAGYSSGRPGGDTRGGGYGSGRPGDDRGRGYGDRTDRPRTGFRDSSGDRGSYPNRADRDRGGYRDSRGYQGGGDRNTSYQGGGQGTGYQGGGERGGRDSGYRPGHDADRGESAGTDAGRELTAQTGAVGDRAATGDREAGYRGTDRSATAGTRWSGEDRYDDRSSRTTRESGPPIPDDINAGDLDKEVREELVTLARPVAEQVARRLVAAGTLVDEDPELALEHALAARRLASRLAVVREAVGIAAYHAGEWATALSELRTYHRMTGRQSHLAVLADCERALGRPEKAVDIYRTADRAALAAADAVELLIVASGARRDLGQTEAAVAMLQVRELGVDAPFAARLRYAYADGLLALDRREEAREWFSRAVDADEDGATDAAERLLELDGIVLEGDEESDEPEPAEADLDSTDLDDTAGSGAALDDDPSAADREELAAGDRDDLADDDGYVDDVGGDEDSDDGADEDEVSDGGADYQDSGYADDEDEDRDDRTDEEVARYADATDDRGTADEATAADDADVSEDADGLGGFPDEEVRDDVDAAPDDRAADQRDQGRPDGRA